MTTLRQDLAGLEAGARDGVPGGSGGGSHRLRPVPVRGGRLGGHRGPGGQEDHGLQTQHPRQTVQVRQKRNLLSIIDSQHIF